MFNFFGRRRCRCASRNLIYNLVNYDIAKKLIEDSNNILIDVRTKREYDIMHIVNAVNIPVDNLKMCEE